MSNFAGFLPLDFVNLEVALEDSRDDLVRCFICDERFETGETIVGKIGFKLEDSAYHIHCFYGTAQILYLHEEFHCIHCKEARLSYLQFNLGSESLLVCHNPGCRRTIQEGRFWSEIPRKLRGRARNFKPLPGCDQHRKECLWRECVKKSKVTGVDDLLEKMEKRGRGRAHP